MSMPRLIPAAGPRAGPAPANRRRAWTAAVSVLLHMVALAALLLLSRRAELPQPTAPSYDLLFEDPGRAAPATAPDAPETQQPATPRPESAPFAPPAPPDAAPQPMPEPQPETPPTPPAPPEPAPLPPAPSPPGPLPASPAPLPEPESLPGPLTPAPAAPPVPDAPKPETPPPPVSPDPVPVPMPVPVPIPVPVPGPEPAPAPMAEPAPAPVPEPTLPPAPAPPAPAELPAPPIPEVRLEPPAPPPPPRPAAPDFVPPVPPPPLPSPPRAVPPRMAPPTVGTFANPMDLDFRAAPPPRAPAPRLNAARGSAASRSLDLAPGAPKPGPNTSDAFFDARARNLGADWMQGVKQYWLQHRYYPRQAAEAGEDGTVDLELTVSRGGRVQSAVIKSRSGSAFIDMAAMGTFRGAQLPPLPAEVRDPYTVTITINYILIR